MWNTIYLSSMIALLIVLWRYWRRFWSPPVQYVEATFNGDGFPRPHMTWNDAIAEYPIMKMFPYLLKPPTNCPTCKSELKVEYHDLWQFEKDYAQYMVKTHTCPSGHGHYCEFA